MTAGPSQFPDREQPAWYVHTADDLVCSGPHPTEAQARAAGNAFAADLRATMRREHYNERQIATRVRALRVGFGIRQHPYNRFVSVSLVEHILDYQ